MLVATMSWLAALTVWPPPLGPTRTTVLPTASKTGRAASKSARSPPTMMDRAAFFAPASPPETGASRMRSPRFRACLASSPVTSGRMLEKSMTSVPGLAFSKTPPAPVSTSWTSGKSGTMTAATSASRTASPIDAAPRPPCSTSRSTAAGERLTPTTSNPASTRCAAIGPPMMPSPMKPIVVMRLPCTRSERIGSWTTAPGRARKPTEAVGARSGRRVLQADVARVPDAGELVEVTGDVEDAAAGLVPTGGIGDLHVADAVGVRGQRGVDVVAVRRQVIDVEQQPQIVRSGLALHTVDHGDRIGGGAQRIPGGAADRLDEHNPARFGDRTRRQGQILGTEGTRSYPRRRSAVSIAISTREVMPGTSTGRRAAT